MPDLKYIIQADVKPFFREMWCVFMSNLIQFGTFVDMMDATDKKHTKKTIPDSVKGDAGWAGIDVQGLDDVWR